MLSRESYAVCQENTKKKKKMENSDLAYCPAGVIPLGLVEQLIYLQGCYSLHKLKHSAIFIVLAYNV